MGMEEPKGLRLLSNDLLQAALLSKATEYTKRDERKGTKEVRRRLHDIVEIAFTESEWSKFKISDLRIDQYVRGDNLRFFVTAEKRASDREQLKLSRELCEAAVNGDNRQTINMLSAKANPDARDHFENTPLSACSEDLLRHPPSHVSTPPPPSCFHQQARDYLAYLLTHLLTCLLACLLAYSSLGVHQRA